MTGMVSLYWAPFFVNCFSAIALIFLNRYLLRACEFRFVGFLAALHTGVTSVVAWQQSTPKSQPTVLSIRENLVFMFFSDLSIISMNISLMSNSVGVYQLSKILVIPTCSLFDFFIQNKRENVISIFAIVNVMLGVAIATVKELHSSIIGSFAAIFAVLSASAHSVGCSYISKKHKMASVDFVMQTVPLQFLSLSIAGPIFDVLTVKSNPLSWVRECQDNSCTSTLAVTCIFAAIVNISLVTCIKRYTATGTQILGHCKTIFILIMGWIDLYRTTGVVNTRQYTGCAFAVLGMVMYSNSEKVNNFVFSLLEKNDVSGNTRPNEPGSQTLPDLRDSATHPDTK